MLNKAGAIAGTQYRGDPILSGNDGTMGSAVRYAMTPQM